MNVEFKFAIRSYVRVTLHNVNYRGRVNRCIGEGSDSPNIYQVVYCDDKGDFQSREFYEDELIHDSP